jgi:hypothetical protein
MFQGRCRPLSIADCGRGAGDNRRRGARHAERVVGLSWSHEPGIRPRPSHTSRTAHPRTTGAAAHDPGATRTALGPHTPDRGALARPPPSPACGHSASECCRPSRLLRGAGRRACRRGHNAPPTPARLRIPGEFTQPLNWTVPLNVSTLIWNTCRGRRRARSVRQIPPRRVPRPRPARAPVGGRPGRRA